MLAKEVSSDYEDEMLKAQAVIVRTTVYSEIKELNKELLVKPDIDTGWYKKLKDIWKETEGQVLLYNNELFLPDLQTGTSASLQPIPRTQHRYSVPLPDEEEYL